MKKTIILFSAVALGIFTSCNNDNTVNPKEELGKATISGIVYANTNYVTDGEEKVANLKVVARVWSGDLVTSRADVNYGYQYIETTTNADGKYTIEVPANKNSEGFSVEIIPADFQFDVQISASEKENKTFYGNWADRSVTVYNGGTFFLDLDYND